MVAIFVSFQCTMYLKDDSWYTLEWMQHLELLCFKYCEVPHRRADRNKRADLEKSTTLLAYFLSKLINEQGGIFRLLCGWHVNRKDVTKWRNDKFWNFHATYSNVFFWSTKLSQPRQCRDSCTYYIIFQNFVISSFRHIFSIDTPTT